MDEHDIPSAILRVIDELNISFDTAISPEASVSPVPATSPEASVRQTTAANMLLALKPFAARLIDFFSQGFSDTSPSGLPWSDCEPPAYVYGLIAEQVAYDVDEILRAYSQRKIAEILNPSASKIKAKTNLQFADRLGYQILIPAILNIAVKPATVFTYFQKSTRIRLIPYACVAFVGIPYSAMEDANDYVTLAHELGHFVYRYGVFEDKRNRIRQLRDIDQTQWYGPWLEEIFADIFGCLFAGPRIAKSCQNLQRQMHARWFNVDNGEHPAPFLRPYIYIDTLKELAKLWSINLTNVTDSLETSWEDHLRNETKVQLPGHDCPLLLCKARTKIIDDIIIPILTSTLEPLVDALGPNGPYKDSLFRRWWGSIDQWNTMVQNDTLPELLSIDAISLTGNEQIVPELIQVAGVTPIELTVETHPVMAGVSSLPIPLGKTNTVIDIEMENLTNPTEEETDTGSVAIKLEKWLKLLTFGGWIEKGPGGGNGHKT